MRRSGLVILILSLSSLVGLLVAAPSIPTAHASPSTTDAPQASTSGGSSAEADNPLALDSSSSVSCNGCTTQSLHLRMIQGDVVVVQTELSPQSSTSRGGGLVGLSSLTSSATTPFQLRFAWNGLLPIYESVADETFVWTDWSVATTSAVATITGTVNGSKAAWSMIAYSVSGANTSDPWDSAAGLPVAQLDNDCNDVDGCSVNFSTVSAYTMVIVGLGSEACPTVVPPSDSSSGTNFTLIASTCNDWSTDAVAYQYFSSPQNNTVTGSWSLNGGQGESALWFADAIQACEGSCPPVNPPVTQPISVQMNNSAPAGNVSVIGCYAYPSSFMSDGKPHLITMNPSCDFTLSFSSGAGIRDGFPVSGSFNSTSSPLTSCATGTCPPVSTVAYEQLENTYLAKPPGYLTWDADLSIPVRGTQLGIADQQGCTISAFKGGGTASCEAWFDYGTQVQFGGTVAVSSTEKWTESGVANFTQYTAGNQDLVTYVDEFQIGILANPDGAGTANSTSTKLWAAYDSTIPITATPATGYLFDYWSSSTSSITFESVSAATTAATVVGAGNITANFSTPVTQPVDLSLVEQNGTNADFTVSGCGISAAHYDGDGEPQDFDVLPSCRLTINVETTGPGLRYGFDANGTLDGETTFVTCDAPTCPSYSASYYEQLNEDFSYNITGGTAPYVEPPSVTYVSLGTTTTDVLPGNPLSIWVDYGSSWSLTNPLPGSNSEERWLAASGTTGTADAVGSQVATFQHQFIVKISVSPSGCGNTNPGGSSWEDAGVSFQVTVSSASDCTFSSWNTAGTITIPQPDQPSTNVFADSNGTVTASFSKNLLPSLPSIRLIVLDGLGLVAVAFIGVYLARNRRRTQAHTSPPAPTGQRIFLAPSNPRSSQEPS